MKKVEIGIALGGGGSRGFAHLGILKALEEKGIRPEVVAGTSAGAIVGALFAWGYGADDIRQIMHDNKLTDFAKLAAPWKGLLSLDHLEERLESLLEGATFALLKLPFYAAATNLLTGEVEYLHSGKVSRAVKASASIPVLFNPVELDGQVYVDGGMRDNVPVQPLLQCARRIIAVDIMPVERIQTVENLADIAARTFQMGIRGLEEKEGMEQVFAIRIEALAGYNLLSSDHAEEIYQKGYDHGKQLDFTGFL